MLVGDSVANDHRQVEISISKPCYKWRQFLNIGSGNVQPQICFPTFDEPQNYWPLFEIWSHRGDNDRDGH